MPHDTRAGTLHWLTAAVVKTGLVSNLPKADILGAVPPGAGTNEAWDLASKAFELSHEQIARILGRCIRPPGSQYPVPRTGGGCLPARGRGETPGGRPPAAYGPDHRGGLCQSPRRHHRRQGGGPGRASGRGRHRLADGHRRGTRPSIQPWRACRVRPYEPSAPSRDAEGRAARRRTDDPFPWHGGGPAHPTDPVRGREGSRHTHQSGPQGQGRTHLLRRGRGQSHGGVPARCGHTSHHVPTAALGPERHVQLRQSHGGPGRWRTPRAGLPNGRPGVPGSDPHRDPGSRRPQSATGGRGRPSRRRAGPERHGPWSWTTSRGTGSCFGRCSNGRAVTWWKRPTGWKP